MLNQYINIQNTKSNLDISDWRTKEFSNPNGLIRLGTTFSGIGAIEYAFKEYEQKKDLLSPAQRKEQ